MSLTIGIVGLPNVGKSTLFSALTKHTVPIENYPFCTIDPSVGVVAVPDKRLTQLSELSQSVKTVPATVSFVDIAGLVKGASTGEGLGNKFLSNIKDTDAILHVVRFFDNADIHHVDGEVDPLRDMETINLELILADIETVAKRKERIAREVKRGDTHARLEESLLTRIEQTLHAGKFANTVSISEDEIPLYKQLQLLTAKQMFYALNIESGGHNFHESKDEKYTRALAYIASQNAEYVFVDADTEYQLNDVAEDDKKSFRQELGALEDGVQEIIRKGYAILNLITFFTTGEKETKAWTIPKGATAPAAAGVIHSDFEQKFIRAEIIPTEKLLESGSFASAREKGEIRTEGKEYVMQDGDVAVFLHS